MAALLVCLTCSGLYAQEGRTDKLDSLGWSGSVGLTALIQGGNLTKTAIIISSDLAYTWQKTGLTWLGNMAYSNRIGNQPVEREYLGALALRLLPHRRLYPTVLATAEKSRLRAIAFRWNTGLGLSYHLIENHLSSLRASVLVLHESSRYETATVVPSELDSRAETQQQFVGMLRLRGENELLAHRLRMSYNTLLQTAFANLSDYRWAVYLNLDLPLSHHVALRSVVQYSYERFVAVGTQPVNFIYTAGMSIYP